MRVCGLIGIGLAVALARLGEPGEATESGVVVQEALADGVAAMLVAVLGWTVLVAMTARLGRLPGRAGARAQACWRALVPAAARLALGAALGVQGMTGAALAVDERDASAISHPAVARPGAGAAAVVPPAAALIDRHAPVTVAPGDSLWRIAERHRGCEDPAVVAAEWPRWYQTNRAVIGPDPDLLAVGVVLTAPPAPEDGR